MWQYLESEALGELQSLHPRDLEPWSDQWYRFQNLPWFVELD